jgi:hypothetical protein
MKPKHQIDETLMYSTLANARCSRFWALAKIEAKHAEPVWE